MGDSDLDSVNTFMQMFITSITTSDTQDHVVAISVCVNRASFKQLS